MTRTAYGQLQRSALNAAQRWSYAGRNDRKDDPAIRRARYCPPAAPAMNPPPSTRARGSHDS
jgi:hypothetical protein